MKKLTVFTTVFAAAFAVCLLFSVIPAFAEQKEAMEPCEATMSQAALNGYTEEKWAALKDNRLEFDEIKDLIHNFNPSMSQYWDSYEDSVRSVKNSANIMRDAKKEAADIYAQYKDNPYIDPVTKAQLKGVVTLTSTMLTQYNETYDGLKKDSSSNKQLRSAEDQITKAAEQLMTGYKTVESNIRILKKLVQLNEASAATYEAMAENGMATEADVLSAEASLISSKANLSNLEATGKKLYETLITLCGWDITDNVIIGDIPGTDKSVIDSFDPQKDYEKAAGNNTELISLRSEERNKNQGIVETQDAYYKYMSDSLRVKLDTLYAAMQGAMYEYEGAQAGYAGAQIQEAAALKQYESGLLSEAQYIGASIQVLQKEAALETARGDLKQAVSDYEWAVKGLCDLN